LELEKHLVLVQLPPARAESGHIIQDQTERVARGDSTTLEALHRTKDIAYEMKRALLRTDVPGFGRLLDEAWEAKKRFTAHITNPEIDRLYAAAKQAGAIGGKITGAGGGGHMSFLCQANREQEVMAALEHEGAKPVDLFFDTEGLKVWEAEY
jgi:D-glycero-alpha-D-manno-heptose-7-phosphate kinase